jgi:hypothetical protein
MKTISTIGLLILVSISYALASGGPEVEGLGPMTAFFIAFGVLIVLYQFIPGLMLFTGILKKIFLTTAKKISASTGINNIIR